MCQNRNYVLESETKDYSLHIYSTYCQCVGTKQGSHVVLNAVAQVVWVWPVCATSCAVREHNSPSFLLNQVTAKPALFRTYLGDLPS